MSNFFLKNKGASIIEIVIALGIFAIMASSFAVVLSGSFAGMLRGGEFLQTESLAQEAEGAIIAIKKRAFNKLVYDESSIVFSEGKWELSGEGDNYSQDGFLREIYFYDVFRDEDGVYAEDGDVGAFNDPLSKKILIKINWQSGNKDLLIERETLISSWESKIWKQDDFTGGSGLDIWDNDNFYYEDDGNIDSANLGALKLAMTSTSTYASYGYLISSAFFGENTSAFNAIFWEENDILDCDDCEIRVQIKTAPDNSGIPGTWNSTWSGSRGEDGNETDYFSINTGELIHFSHNGDEWIRYKIILLGDSLSTPELNNISIFYQ